MYAVGLTGGIGSGKSTVAQHFAALGVPVIDTDVIAHELTAVGGAALDAIRTAFGISVMQADGALDRTALRRVVFADAQARRRLEAILHPLIRCRVEAALAQVTAPYALVVVPLLVETGAYRDVLNRVLLVDCSEALQIERVRARSAMAEAEVRAILAAQATRAQRLAAADDVILNDGALASLNAEVVRLHQSYLACAAGASP